MISCNDTLVGGDGQDLINLWGKAGGDNSVGTVVSFRTATSGNATFAQDNGTVTFSEFEQFWTHEGRDTVSGANADVGVGATGIWFNTRWGDDILTGTHGRHAGGWRSRRHHQWRARRRHHLDVRRGLSRRWFARGA